MRQCSICGEYSAAQSPADSTFVCKTCYELLRFCAAFDRVAALVGAPVDEEDAGAHFVESLTARPVHPPAPAVRP